MKKFIWMSCLSYMVIGMAHVVAGAILEPMIAKYGLDYQSGGQFIMNQFLGFLGGVLLTPWLAGQIGRRNTLLVALGSLTLAEIAYSFFPPWGWMLSIAPFAGLGFGMTEAIIGAMIIAYVKEKTASAFSFVETFFGIGALAMPIAAALLIKQGAWGMSFPIVAVVTAITMILWLVVSFGSIDELMAERGTEAEKVAASSAASSTKGQRGYPLSTLPFVILGSMFFMLYVGMEMSFSNYLPSIMIERLGISDAAAASSISMFWGLMVVGRLFAGRVADYVGYMKYLLFATISGLVVMGVLGMMQQFGWSYFFIGLSGLIWSGVFAITLVYINQKLPGFTERTTSLMVACGGLGGATFPKLTGWLMDQYNAGFTMAMLVAMSLLMLVIMLLLFVLGRRMQPAALS